MSMFDREKRFLLHEITRYDMERFVQKRIPEHKIPATVRAHIVKEIPKKAEGVFLWVRLVVGFIRDEIADDETTVQARIDDATRRLYTRFKGFIEASTDDGILKFIHLDEDEVDEDEVDEDEVDEDEVDEDLGGHLTTILNLLGPNPPTSDEAPVEKETITAEDMQNTDQATPGSEENSLASEKGISATVGINVFASARIGGRWLSKNGSAEIHADAELHGPPVAGTAHLHFWFSKPLIESSHTALVT
ncbi:hypothetical protein B0T26DRAFT_867582 [Lasiosphaeria miniovina]|uniref:Uncharacterized protein n=1 Tax=Lasiosphaeria miniovina TaxID=1954250 RepID=A0AA40BHX6_9PEZI|nr:uncharacterized protein B0T26DRAFT_867582 [Lasiosphaeria miniovina]KAK0734532.1 hypothetical protein B0T26DRAFT_867582 [Lasiosphaeria miniovina]